MNTIYLKTTNHNKSLTRQKFTWKTKVRTLAHDFEDGDDSLYKVDSNFYSKDELLSMFLPYGVEINIIEAYLLGKILQPDRLITIQPTGSLQYTFDTVITMDLAIAKAVKNGFINARTGELIDTGKHEFPADSEDYYSTSKYARENIESDRNDFVDGVLDTNSNDRIMSLKDDTTKPLKCSDIKAFHASLKKSVIDQKTAGQLLRNQVNAITATGIPGIQAVLNIQDNRK